MLWSGSKCAVYTACIVGASLLIGVHSRLGSEDIDSELSHAARFAAGYESGIAHDLKPRASLKEKPSAADNVAQKQKRKRKPETMARSMLSRTLKLSQKEIKKQAGDRQGEKVEAEAEAGSGVVKRNGRTRQSSSANRNDNDESSAVNVVDTMNSDRQEDITDRIAKRNSSRQNGVKTRNEKTPDDTLENMKVNLKKNKSESKRESKKDDKKKNSKNKLKESANGESIAETLARIQLKFQPQNDMKTYSQEVMSSTENNNPYPYRYPQIRYVPWDKLSVETKEILDDAFRYDEKSWDHLFSHVAESKRFKQLKKRQQESALMLGIDDNVWDCFINHYTSYRKNDLEELGLNKHFAILANVLSKKWAELSKAEKNAARKLCYSEEVWNQETLGTW